MSKEHTDLNTLVARWLKEQHGIDLVATELGWFDSVFDVVGCTVNPRSKAKITIIESKRTRADLLQDLRKGKMLKYTKHGSHCYLAATAQALNHTTVEQTLLDLTNKGLPTSWGVLLISNDQVVCLRAARKTGDVHPLSHQRLIASIARSYMYKYLLK